MADWLLKAVILGFRKMPQLVNSNRHGEMLPYVVDNNQKLVLGDLGVFINELNSDYRFHVQHSIPNNNRFRLQNMCVVRVSNLNIFLKFFFLIPFKWKVNNKNSSSTERRKNKAEKRNRKHHFSVTVLNRRKTTHISY